MKTTGEQPHTGGGGVPSHETADWLRATIDLAPIGIAHLALDGRILLANDRLCAMLGYTCDELLARTLQGVAHTDDIAGCMARTAQLAVGKASSYREEMRFVHANGSTLRCRVSVSAVPHGALIPAFLVAMVEEIPEEHAPEAEEKPGYPAKFLDITDEAVVAFDAAERITFWNRGAERAFGWTAEEVRGKSAAEVLWPGSTEHEKRDNAQRFEILGRGDTVTGVYTARRKDGMPRTIAFTARAFFDANGMLAGYIAVHRNVTDPPQGEREARVHTEQAKQLRDEMLAVVAHDLRSPLNTIALAAAMLKIVPPEDEPTRQFVQRSATSMERLVRDLLDVTRIEAGTFAVHHARVLVAPLLQEVCEQFAAAAREREITLVCDMTRGVRAMVGDRERLAQVLSNLIANAIKFTPPQGGVNVRAQVRDRHVQISVEDTGPDVHPASLPHVFDRFWPAERASSAGAGLGLQIAKGIVEAHGGCLWAENTLGRGTTFHFTIPARS